MLAKIYDETRPTGERKSWIAGDEPLTEVGQQAIAQRINETISAAKAWQQPNLLTRGWDLTLEPNETARVVMELARYALSETQCPASEPALSGQLLAASWMAAKAVIPLLSMWLKWPWRCSIPSQANASWIAPAAPAPSWR